MVHDTLWNPWNCPAEFLPFLAWSVSVDTWDSDWPERIKRARIASSFQIQRHKGTAKSIAELIASFGGIPLIYMGDELALLNDRSFRNLPEHAHDSRWIHRPRMDWPLADRRHDDTGPTGQVFRGTRHILARRRATPGLHAGHPCQILRTEAPGLFAFRREAPTGAILCLFNFTEAWQHLPEAWARAEGASRMHDLLSDQPVAAHHGNIALPPYARVWLV